MKKNACVVVVGYIAGEIYKEVSEALMEFNPSQSKPVESGIHVYEYSSEGMMAHLCTNFPLPEGTDVGYILTEASEADESMYAEGAEEAGVTLYNQALRLEGYQETPDMDYLGSVHGYNEDGIGRYEE